MCFSAEVKQKVNELSKRYDAQIDLPLYEKLFKDRLLGSGAKILKCMEASFLENPTTQSETSIAKDILEWNRMEIADTEHVLITQTQRLNDAQQSISKKITKKAEEEIRIATNKIKNAKYKLEHLKNWELTDKDYRLFPFIYASLIVMINGKRMLRPFRYLMRPHGQKESFDRKFGGCYNVRKDSLESVAWWKSVYGKNHGILVIDKFYENVKLTDYEHRPLREHEQEENVVLEFSTEPLKDLIVPCLFDYNTEGKFPLYSFAMITDEPNPEVAATGHNRTPIIMKEKNIDQWLETSHSSMNEYESALKDKQTTYFSHQIAA